MLSGQFVRCPHVVRSALFAQAYDRRLAGVGSGIDSGQQRSCHHRIVSTSAGRAATGP